MSEKPILTMDDVQRLVAKANAPLPFIGDPAVRQLQEAIRDNRFDSEETRLFAVEVAARWF